MRRTFPTRPLTSKNAVAATQQGISRDSLSKTTMQGGFGSGTPVAGPLFERKERPTMSASPGSITPTSVRAGAAAEAEARRLRILQIGMWWATSGLGGLDRVFADLFAHLPATGVDVRGCVLGPADVGTRTGGRIRNFAEADAGILRRLIGVRTTAMSMLADERIDAVASHFGLFALPLLDRLRGRPFVMHFHGPWSMEAAAEGAPQWDVATRRRLERAVYTRADRVIVLSNAFARLVRDQYDVSEQRIRVVPGTVDIERFASRLTRHEARLRLGWPTERPILFSVRRLTHRMGLSNLIAAMPQIIERVPEVMLFIAGKGPMREILSKQIDNAGLERHVRLLGFTPEEALPLAFRAADISIVPSTALEGFGLVVAESLAAGTPAMVSPVGGLPEVVGALSSDLVFRSVKPRELAERLVAGLRGDIALPSAEMCRDYAAKNFPSELAASRTAAVYREVCT